MRQACDAARTRALLNVCLLTLVDVVCVYNYVPTVVRSQYGTRTVHEIENITDNSEESVLTVTLVAVAPYTTVVGLTK